MEWVLRSPQIHSTFGNLGFAHGDGYQVNENCNATLETILHNILTEDKYLRTYRRCISFGQNIKKDIIPLLIHTKDDKTVQLLINILVNLTIPVECLLSLDIISKTDHGRQTVFEINNLLASAKIAFTDNRATKVIIDFLKKNSDEHKGVLSPEQCTNVSNSLLLLRNILHIPNETNSSSPNYNGPGHSTQNQILWNIFSQSIDKMLIKLMVIPDATNWAVTMVQLVALLYKDQHVVTLHKLLNMWLEGSLSESSEDNESNTSPPDRGSEDSSPILTSDPTSDSSDNGGSAKCIDEQNSVKNEWDSSSVNNTSEIGENHLFQQPSCGKTNPEKNENNTTYDTEKSDDDKTRSGSNECSDYSNPNQSQMSEKKAAISEISDCGYGTQIENQESISTSSNEDELPSKKPVHQKPHNPKQRPNNKVRTCISLQEKRRRKIVKRSKSNLINVQGLLHKAPTDDDISNILKEFTVDFLLKGYNSLVQTLHNQILANSQLEIDTSHFFWLVTYFLKFATQIELDLEHICSVLSFDIASYLTAEGVNLCEQFELAIKLDGNDLKPRLRRLHLVVTAIREFVQAIQMYKKFSHICNKDRSALIKLQMKMCDTEELRSLLVLLLRHYSPKYHTKQYLQDLIVTNHILLMFLDTAMKLPEYNSASNMVDHIKQFATPEIMYQYGLLLEDYEGNGEFVNDCIFTLMHHVGGELGCLISLFQPKILKTFTSIWKSEFEICDDWSDLIEYVINTFIKKPHILQNSINFRLETENFEDDKSSGKKIVTDMMERINKVKDSGSEPKRKVLKPGTSNSSRDKWTEEELSALSWNYVQSNTSSDVVGEIVRLYKDDGIFKSRETVIRELFKQKIIVKEEFERLSKGESERSSKLPQLNKEMRDDEIGKLCEQLKQDGKSKFLDWVQRVILDTCFAKLYLEKSSRNTDLIDCKKIIPSRNFELFQETSDELPVISPVSYYSLNYNQSVPLVPWNCEQAAIYKDLKFLQLLHRLGFHMPVDTGKVFIRIPHFWTADLLYEVAGKVAPIDTSKLKFFVNNVSGTGSTEHSNFNLASQFPLEFTPTTIPPTVDNFYQIHKRKHHAMVNFTPMPGSSFNSEIVGVSKHNWLEVIQKSQETKLILKTNELKDVSDDKSELELPAAASELKAPVGRAPLMAAKQDCESEYYINSVCETASVASDLTRMYVSDEDEKPEPLHPDLLLAADPPGSPEPEKRPRVQFSSTY